MVSFVNSEEDPDAAATVPVAPGPHPDLAFVSETTRAYGQYFGTGAIDASGRPKELDWKVVLEARDWGTTAASTSSRGTP